MAQAPASACGAAKPASTGLDDHEVQKTLEISKMEHMCQDGLAKQTEECKLLLLSTFKSF
jgi:hypothetical protein